MSTSLHRYHQHARCLATVSPGSIAVRLVRRTFQSPRHCPSCCSCRRHHHHHHPSRPPLPRRRPSLVACATGFCSTSAHIPARVPPKSLAACVATPPYNRHLRSRPSFEQSRRNYSSLLPTAADPRTSLTLLYPRLSRQHATMAEALHSRSPPSGVERLADALEKPLLDDRSYRVIKLPNQLEALLIHDPDTDKASAAMDVNVGSFSDGDDMPGIAHAVEHLLFMGTEKYPGENDYNSYLTKYGGYSNAFTASTSTNYYFELSAKSTSNSPGASAPSSSENLPSSKTSSPLYGALDRFAQFFVRPLFLEDTLDRELKAVDSENKKNLQSDMWRLHQLHKNLSNKQHPYNKFSTGNYKVLRDDPVERGVAIRDEFMKFYADNYSANRMKLVVLGKEQLDELQSWVEEFFKDVPDQNLKQLRWDEVPIYTQDEIGTQVFAKPVMDSRSLDIYFQYPDEDEMYASQPGRYLSHLIGHEGPGSILAYLKSKGWANSLSAGASPICPGSGIFDINIRLTEEGLKHYHEIIKVVFQYIAMIKEQPVHKWIFEEMSKLAEVDFRFKQKSPASSTTSRLSGIMQKPFPRDQILSAQSLIREFNPEGIKRGLDHLDPDNFRIMVVSKELPGEWPMKEKWYGTEYKYERVPKQLLQEVKNAYEAPASARPAELHLPAKNEFVPQRLDVEKREVAEPARNPSIIRNEPNIRTWFKKDDRFWVPKANVNLCFRSPVAGLTPYTSTLSTLFKELVEDSLDEYSYDAEIAGLVYGISTHSQGIDVTINGYNDKIAVLLEKVLISMRDLEIKQERFDIIKERLVRAYKNFDYQEPFRQIQSTTRGLATAQSFTHLEILEELGSITAQEVRDFVPQLLRQFHIEALIHGNMYKEDALRISDLVSATLNPKSLPQSQWPVRRSVIFAPGSNYYYQHTLSNPDNVNHCIEYVLIFGDIQDRELRAKIFLLDQIAHEPCFDTLRTKEQLGYVVGSGAIFMNTTAAYRILIQSERDCEYLDKRIDSFLYAFEKTVAGLSASEFEEHKVSIINKRLETLKNLASETNRFWHHISGEMLDFEAEAIEKLTQEDFLDFYRTKVLPSSPVRAKLAVHLIAKASAGDIAAKIEPSEQKEKLVGLITQLLSQLGVTVDEATLTRKFSSIDITTGETEGIIGAVRSYLEESAGAAKDQIEQIVTQGQAVLAQALPQLGIQTAKKEDVGGEDLAAKAKAAGVSEPVLIEDRRAFKAMMPLSKGAVPVRDLSEFEELESKL
nr:a-factor-processing enzyme [Quercus suber]